MLVEICICDLYEVCYFLICVFTFQESKQMPDDCLKRMKLEVALHVKYNCIYYNYIYIYFIYIIYIYIYYIGYMYIYIYM